jgi:Cu(I)/Ag(I) efflux system membrane fusion protein
MKNRFWLFLVVLALGAGAFFVGRETVRLSSERTAKATKYFCPMHPTVTSDKPGECPICHMRLVPIGSHETMGEREDMTGKPSGRVTVTITPELRQKMGLTLGMVEKRALTRELRTSARIYADESRLHRVTVKLDGWVDELFVSVTEQPVRKGEPLLKIYSPELVAAQEEYLVALKTKEQLAAPVHHGETANSGDTLLAAARRRLQLLDLTEEQIAQLEKTRRVEKTVTLYSPVSGIVLKRDVQAGQKIMAGETLLAVADLSNVWADADIYQPDLPFVKIGTPVEITLPQWGEKVFAGKVSFVSQSLNPETRTARARLEIPNPELLLKPEMFAAARLRWELGEKLVVPEAALLRTGEHTYVFRDGGEGRLVPIEIKIGARGDGFYEVISGLSAGDRVVTSANFLVDSESAIKAALQSRGGSERQPHQH